MVRDDAGDPETVPAVLRSKQADRRGVLGYGVGRGFDAIGRGYVEVRPQDWKSGDNLWVVETIAPFGGAEEMAKDLKAAVFPDRKIRMIVVKDGVRDVRAV